MSGLRISAISFLNTAPLMWDFEHGDAGQHFQIKYTLPSACAAALASNQADIGIIPAFTYAQIPALVILPGIAIASKDRVRSILLVSKKPIEQAQDIAVDTSSRTSVGLLQVLLAKVWGGSRRLTPCPPDLDVMLRDHDAALLIGDAALQVRLDSGYQIYDLAHEWRTFTGKPFVFAFWAVRMDALDRVPENVDLAKLFQQSRDHGLQPASLAIIAREWSLRLSISEKEVEQYLRCNIHYYLDRENHAGLQLFMRYCRELELIEQVPELRFLGPVAFGRSRK